MEFAVSQGFVKENSRRPEREWKEWFKNSDYKPIANIENHDTIGMIALDANGDLSGALQRQ
jgi:N4-(beta-N-acetylglucosaminyl)-L-asparaginase